MAEGAGNGVGARGLTRSGLGNTSRSGAPIRLTAVAVLGLAIVSVLSFSTPGGARVSVPFSVHAAVLSADAADGYSFTTADRSVEVAAGAQNVSGNLRTVFWPTDSRPLADELTCATWTGATSGEAQQGAALRISTTSSGSVRAITVTRNIYLDPRGIFNVHLWNNASNQMRLIAETDLRAAFSRPPDRRGGSRSVRGLPWRLCARVSGSTLEFKVWQTEELEPAWGDPGQGASVQLPAEAPAEGYAGWYIGHLEPGTTASFAELVSAPSVPAR